MSETVSFTRKIPVRHTVDVFVAGGGPAGVAAAVTAAHQGRSVYLAEGHTCFGGMGTAGLVPAFMQFTDHVNFLAGGFGKEIHDRLFEANGAGPYDKRDSDWGGMCIKAEVLKRVYDDMTLECGMAFTFQTQMIGVEVEDGTVTCAICAAKSGVFAVKANIFIDCTGDGDLAAWAGAPFEKGDANGNLMPGTLCSLWCGIDWPIVRARNPWAEPFILKAIEEGRTKIKDRHHPGIWAVGHGLGGGNIGHTFGVDATDERSLTKALIEGRRMMIDFEEFYKEFLRGYDNLQLVATGSLLGVRETRRIMGDYVLCLDDFHKRATFDDEIGRYAYPVDIHPSSPDIKTFKAFQEEFKALRYQPGESYGIPYRTLIPRKLNNVLVAGRCISADRYIQGSIRVMPGCYITGQAAGVAAAIAVDRKTGTRQVPITELQARLKKIGGYLPNAPAVTVEIPVPQLKPVQPVQQPQKPAES
ncbi:MAG TPA: FAD-dependent oxidoreductase [Planctomycetota bacterium]|nr:FAD-dependent oxidoreductase [Planctomycetota bacterium]